MLRAGETVGDATFDRIYPHWARRASRTHWTPIEVARRAADFLTGGRGKHGARVLDVGSGVGKLCIVGALTTNGSFVGVEQRVHLVTVARRVVEHHRVERCRFIHGNMIEIDWSAFDAFYFYNPFAEHLPWENRLDDTIARTPADYVRYVRFVEERLRSARAGTRVATYHGFGGTMPAECRLVSREHRGSGPLELWIKE